MSRRIIDEKQRKGSIDKQGRVAQANIRPGSRQTPRDGKV